MKKVLLLGMAMGLLVLAGAAFAYPTLTGNTGLVNQPNAMVAPAGQWNLAVDFYNTEQLDNQDSIPIRVLYGIAPGWELGAGFDVNGAIHDDIFSVNTKYKIPVQVLGADWAVGANYQAVDPIDYTSLQPYLVGTKRLMGDAKSPKLDGTIGVNWTRTDFGGAVAEGIRGFVGVELTMPGKLSLAAEYQTESAKLNDGDPIWGVVARYPLTANLTGEVGVTNGNDSFWAYDKAAAFAGVNASF